MSRARLHALPEPSAVVEQFAAALDQPRPAPRRRTRADRDPGDPQLGEFGDRRGAGRARTFTGRSTDDTIARSVRPS